MKVYVTKYKNNARGIYYRKHIPAALYAYSVYPKAYTWLYPAFCVNVISVYVMGYAIYQSICRRLFFGSRWGDHKPTSLAVNEVFWIWGYNSVNLILSKQDTCA